MLKKYALLAIVATLFLSSSPAKTALEKSTGSHTTPVTNLRMSTKSVLARVVARPQKKFLAVYSVIDDNDDDDPAGPEELDLHNSYRRPQVADKPQHHKDDDDEVSDYVAFRLFLARAKALALYKQKYTSA